MQVMYMAGVCLVRYLVKFADGAKGVWSSPSCRFNALMLFSTISEMRSGRNRTRRSVSWCVCVCVCVCVGEICVRCVHVCMYIASNRTTQRPDTLTSLSS